METIDFNHWILLHYNMWEKICKANGQAFMPDELPLAFLRLLHLCRANAQFEVLFMVFLTIYESEILQNPRFLQCL